MNRSGIDDPFQAVKISAWLVNRISQAGFEIHVDNNLEKLNSSRILAREEQVSPFFDENVCGLTPSRFFWMKLQSPTLKVAALQAYRYDYVDTNLTDWLPSYHIGLYMRRNEICLPTHAAPPAHSIADRVRGRLVYHGEFWVSPMVRNRKIMEQFSRLGMILAFLKWHPDAVWALSTKSMATHGHPSRMGYTYMEGGFLRWQWAADEKHHVEYLNVSERHSIEQMISDISLELDQADASERELLTAGEYLPARFR
jgi:hypothetical protein